MAFPRLAGIILHPTSLPGGHGVGDLGDQAYRFVDFLHKSAIGIWQVLPLGPTSGAHSPYQSLSSFAGNPMLISLDKVAEEDLLLPGELAGGPANSDQADYAGAADFKEKALRMAFSRFEDGEAEPELVKECEAFVLANNSWLEDFAFFVALKKFFNGAAWYQWKDPALRSRQPEAMKKYHKLLSGEIRFAKFCQFLFFRQWHELKNYAAARHIKLMGDVPIYCAHDSADVWASPEFFQLDADGSAALMAGVPPDYFSPTGQLWGNPLYDWKALEADSFKWWIKRIKQNLNLVDMLRIDHFRGFQAYWAVKKGETTAMNGKWVLGPGQKFFIALKAALGDNLPIVAEDLGVITPAVDQLRHDNGLPGMKVLHFAFSDGAESYLPYSYNANTVCYVATHDNDTTRGWYEATGPDYEHMSRESLDYERDKARRYLGRDGNDMPWDLMRLALSSVANTAILLMQDVLNLPNSCRLNRPGLGEGQWLWRLTDGQIDEASWGGLRDMIYLYGREPEKKDKEKIEDVDAVKA